MSLYNIPISTKHVYYANFTCSRYLLPHTYTSIYLNKLSKLLMFVKHLPHFNYNYSTTKARSNISTYLSFHKGKLSRDSQTPAHWTIPQITCDLKNKNTMFKVLLKTFNYQIIHFSPVLHSI